MFASDRFITSTPLPHVFATLTATADDPVASGTVPWELDTITHCGLAKANGFDLCAVKPAGKPATQIALPGGEADALVSD